MSDNSILSKEYIKNRTEWDNLNMKSYEAIQNGYKIPNVIHYTFSSTILPIDIYKVIENNKKNVLDVILFFIMTMIVIPLLKSILVKMSTKHIIVLIQYMEQ